MKSRNLSAIMWLPVIVLMSAVLLGGCRDREEYEPPGYAPPPPPPPVASAPAAPTRAPLMKQDPLTLTPKLIDPEDAKGKPGDLKSAIAGIWEDQLVIKYEFYGDPPKDENIWFLAWLGVDPGHQLYKLQFSVTNGCVMGSVFVEKAPGEDAHLSGDVKVDGNSVIARVPWGKLPEKFQVQDLRLESPSVIRADVEDPAAGMIDQIEGFDVVRL